MIIDRTPEIRKVYGLSEEDGLDLLHDGREIRKKIDELAHEVGLMPHQININLEGRGEYLKSYHRIMRNQFWLNDADIVLRKIVRGIKSKIKEVVNDITSWDDDRLANEEQSFKDYCLKVRKIKEEYLEKLNKDLADIREMAKAFFPFILLDDLYRIIDGEKPINEIIIMSVEEE